MKPFNEINQSDTAKRKIKSLAKNSNLEFDFVNRLAKYVWDYDPYGREDTGWVKKEQINQEQFEEEMSDLTHLLNVKDFAVLTKDALIEGIISSHQKKDKQALIENLSSAVFTKNYCYLAEYATFHYLNNLTSDKLQLLDFKGNVNLIQNIFLKIFRGGGWGDRSNLEYCYVDLCIALPYVETNQSFSSDWNTTLIQSINSNGKATSLSDLIKCCKGVMKGDKGFKQEVLQALAYSGEIEVEGVDVSEIFIPEFRNVMSKHFYSNEWTYPLRLWNDNK